jgi:HPt (histidine-containing phosphotransfer) domain-containing protein
MSGNQRTPPVKSSLDPVQLKQLADAVGVENMCGVLDLALISTPLIRDELRAASANGDMLRIARAAHKLKSDCAYLGATELASALTRLELLAEEERATESVAAVSDILVQVDTFLNDVRNERQSRS